MGMVRLAVQLPHLSDGFGHLSLGLIADLGIHLIQQCCSNLVSASSNCSRVGGEYDSVIELLPGSTSRIVVNGTSGGGAQSTQLGATGDSADYLPYLQAAGAAGIDAKGRSAISDSVYAVVAYCSDRRPLHDGR